MKKGPHCFPLHNCLELIPAASFVTLLFRTWRGGPSAKTSDLFAYFEIDSTDNSMIDYATSNYHINFAIANTNLSNLSAKTNHSCSFDCRHISFTRTYTFDAILGLCRGRELSLSA